MDKRRLLLPLGIAALIALIVWKVVLPFVTIEERDDLPSRPDQLSFACDFPGIAYVTGAACEGSAPHPIALPIDDSNKLKDLPLAWRPNSARKVQLIACADRKWGGRASTKIASTA
jgi:hypothetical protein